MRTNGLKTCAAALLWLALFIQTPVLAAPGPIKIAVSASLSGDLAQYGTPTVRAAEMVADKYNAGPKVLGRDIQVLAFDDECLPEKAADVATKVVTKHCPLLVGPLCSGTLGKAMDIYKKHGVTLISPSISRVDVGKGCAGLFFFSINQPDDAQARLQASFATDVLHAGQMAVLHDQTQYGRKLAGFVIKFVNQDPASKVVLVEGLSGNSEKRQKALVDKIAQTHADVLLFCGYHPGAARMLNALRQARMDIPFVAAGGVKNNAFIRQIGQYTGNVYVVGPRDISNNPMAIKAVEEHRTRYGAEPGPFYLNAYACMTALVNAIEKSGSTDGQKVAQALKKFTVETPLGPLHFDEKGRPVGIGPIVYQIKDGKYVETYKGSYKNIRLTGKPEGRKGRPVTKVTP